MSVSRAGLRYAKAILDIALDKNEADAVAVDMQSIADTLHANAELSNFLTNPVLPGANKLSALEAIFSNTSGTTKNVFRLLLENKRFAILGDIATAYLQLNDQRNGIETALVTTAQPLDAALETAVLNSVKALTSAKVTLKNIVDPSIIGGFILRIGDKQFNASVAQRIQNLKRELSN
ncbi:ATP synthase F1 subunit delta [Flavobacterium sp.]|uniref:ATP synthase F1 subunit delta n=1 Tax=Flavobacterium sp. TaxID=239 RepID=UPI00261AC5CB|nr:ATP synthase F1 subunit delta [Flavobacterium sp.]